MFGLGRVRVGVALGSGGGRGLAHIGVLKVLREAGVPIHAVAGSSIGAIVGALYAASEDVSAVERLALTTNWAELMALLDFRVGRGLLQGDRFEHFLRSVLPVATFGELRVPFAALSTDLDSGEPWVWTAGDLARAVRASASVPVVFRPLEHEGQRHCDGGLSVPVPVAAVRELGADVVIAVDLCAHASRAEQPVTGIADVAQRTVHLLSAHLAREQGRGADVVIAPAVAPFGWGAFLTPSGSLAAIAVGEAAARAELTRVRNVCRPAFVRTLRRLLGVGPHVP